MQPLFLGCGQGRCAVFELDIKVDPVFRRERPGCLRCRVRAGFRGAAFRAVCDIVYGYSGGCDIGSFEAESILSGKQDANKDNQRSDQGEIVFNVFDFHGYFLTNSVFLLSGESNALLT